MLADDPLRDLDDGPLVRKSGPWRSAPACSAVHASLIMRSPVARLTSESSSTLRWASSTTLRAATDGDAHLGGQDCAARGRGLVEGAGEAVKVQGLLS